MNNRQLNLVIKGHNQSAGAFKDLNRQIKSVQYQASFFNTHAISGARLFNAAFVGLGSSVENASRQIQRSMGFMEVAVVSRMGRMQNEIGITAKALKDYEKQLIQAARIRSSTERQHLQGIKSFETFRNKQTAAQQKQLKDFEAYKNAELKIQAKQVKDFEALALKQSLVEQKQLNDVAKRKSQIDKNISGRRVGVSSLNTAIADKEHNLQFRGSMARQLAEQIRQQTIKANRFGGLAKAEMSKAYKVRESIEKVKSTGGSTDSIKILTGKFDKHTTLASKHVKTFENLSKETEKTQRELEKVVKGMGASELAIQRYRGRINELSKDISRLNLESHKASVEQQNLQNKIHAAQKQVAVDRAALTAAIDASNQKIGASEKALADQIVSDQKRMLAHSLGLVSKLHQAQSALTTYENQIASSISKTNDQLKFQEAQLARLARFHGHLQNIGGILQGVGEYFRHSISLVGAWGSFFISTIESVVRGLISLGQTIYQTVVSGLQKIALVGGIAGAAILAVGGAAAKTGVQFNAFQETSTMSLEVMLGSAEKAKNAFIDLKRFADVTPFSNVQVIEAGKLLQAYGLDMMKYIRIAGDMSAAFNKPLTQAVDLLARAKAGVFNTRQYAPLGITRESLGSVGVKFDKRGAPTNREELLPGIKKIVASRYQGMMEKLSLTWAGLTERITAFWTDDFLGSMTKGLFSALQHTAIFVADFIGVIRNNGQFDTVIKGLALPFTEIGNLIYGLVSTHLPKLVSWFTKLVDSGKWAEFVGQGKKLLGDFFNWMAKGFEFIANNWGVIWDTVVSGFIFGWKVVAGSFAAITTLVNWIMQNNPGDILNEGFKRLQPTLAFVVDTIKDLVVITSAIGVMKGGTQAALGIAMKNPAAIIAGMFQMAESTLTGTIGADALSGLSGRIKNFKIADVTSNKSLPFGAMGDVINKSNADVDSYVANFRPAGLSAGMPSVFTGGVDKGAAPIIDNTLQKRVDQQSALAKVLGNQVEAWEQIVQVNKEVEKVLEENAYGIQLQVNGVLNYGKALHSLRAGQLDLLKLQEAGTSEWFDTIKALNTTVGKLNEARAALRDILYSTERIRAENDAQAKLFKLAKEVGVDQNTLQQLADAQLDLLIKTVDVESKRLSMLEAGTVEWFKQKGAIIDAFEGIVDIRKEMDKLRGKGDDLLISVPYAPHGYKGASFGPELTRGGGGSKGTEFGQTIMKWLGSLLNPTPFNFDQIAPRNLPLVPSPNIKLKEEVPADLEQMSYRNGGGRGWSASVTSYDLVPKLVQLAATTIDGLLLPKKQEYFRKNEKTLTIQDLDDWISKPRKSKPSYAPGPLPSANPYLDMRGPGEILNRNLRGGMGWLQNQNSQNQNYWNSKNRYRAPESPRIGMPKIGIPKLPAPSSNYIDSRSLADQIGAGFNAISKWANDKVNAGRRDIRAGINGVRDRISDPFGLNKFLNPVSGSSGQPKSSFVNGTGGMLPASGPGIPWNPQQNHMPIAPSHSLYGQFVNTPGTVQRVAPDVYKPRIPSLPDYMLGDPTKPYGQIGGYGIPEGGIPFQYVGNDPRNGTSVQVNAPISINDSGVDLSQMKAEIMAQMEGVVDNALLQLAKKRMNRGGIR